MSDKSIKVILFDLGGVLLRLNDPGETFGLDGNYEEFLKKWLLSPSVRDFERGALERDAFAAGVVAEAGLPYNADEFLARFDSWPDQFFAGALDTVETLAQRYEVALLSNTNAMHWDRADIGGQLETRLSRVFLSYRTGKLKPDADAFQHVCDDLGCDANEVLFFDDNPLNVSAASSVGMNAEFANGIDAVKTALADYEI